MFQAEVSDRTGNVGAAVKRTTSLLGAVDFISATAKESWAGEWRIIDVATGAVVIAG